MDNLGPSYTRSWLSVWLFKLFQYTIINENNDVYKETSDKEIIEKHTGIGDTNGKLMGKYKNWIKAESLVGKAFKDKTGDSTLLIFNDDSILIAPFYFGSNGRSKIDLNQKK